MRDGTLPKADTVCAVGEPPSPDAGCGGEPPSAHIGPAAVGAWETPVASVRLDGCAVSRARPGRDPARAVGCPAEPTLTTGSDMPSREAEEGRPAYDPGMSASEADGWLSDSPSWGLIMEKNRWGGFGTINQAMEGLRVH